MDQNTLQAMLREAMREAVAEVLQILLNLDREAFFGQVEVAIPRDREGRYYPSFLQPYARRLVDVGGQPQAKFPCIEF